MSDLKPCPFCGHIPNEEFVSFSHKDDCFIKMYQQVRLGTIDHPQEEIEKAWNNRVETK